MKIRRNKVGYGLLSLALVLALPLNASATENLTPVVNTETTSESSTNDSENEAPTKDEKVTPDTKPIEDDEINLKDTQDTTKQNTNPNANTTNDNKSANLGSEIDKNSNYISQQGKEQEDKIEVSFDTVELRNKDAEGKAGTFIEFMFGIKGNDLERGYTISVFALKDGQVKNLRLDNFISEDKVTSPSKEMALASEQIESNDILGFRIKNKITYTGSVKAIVEVDDDAEAGDYSLYYVITRDDKTTIGRLDASLGKSTDGSFYKSKDIAKKDYEHYGDEKVNPLENLPFTKYLLNDTEDEKKLTEFLNFEATDYSKYKLVATSINPNTLEAKREDVLEPEKYNLPANSLVRFDIREKTDEENLILDSEINTYDFEISEEKSRNSLMSFMVKEGANKKKTPKVDSEKALREAKDRLEGLLEEKKKSLVELYPDETDREAKALAIILREQTQKIEDLIQQALLDYELDNLTTLEKENPSEAKEEYKRIAQLVKEAEDVNKKANNKLIELDEINLIDNNLDPLLKTTDGAKPVLNLGRLTPLTSIANLTKDSPIESERDFSTNLEKKLDHAVKMVETVTIDEKDDKKANENKEKENKDPNKQVVHLDKKATEKTKEGKAEKPQKTGAKTEPKVNTPIFVKYLQTLQNRSKLIDNK